MNNRYIYSLLKSEQLWSKKKFQLSKSTSELIIVNWQGILPAIEEYTYRLIAMNLTVWLTSESDLGKAEAHPRSQVIKQNQKKSS